LRRESRTRDLALPNNLFFATRPATRQGRNDKGRRSPKLLERDCRHRTTKRRRHRKIISPPDRAIRILPALGVFSLHRISESNFSANGLRLPEVRRSRDGITRAGRQTGRNQCPPYYCARSSNR